MSSRKLCVFAHILARNGSEFLGRLVDLWAYANIETMEFPRLRRPTEKVLVESFNGNIRDEFLNV